MKNSFHNPSNASVRPLNQEAEAIVAMSMNSKIALHLRELEIARNPESPHYAMPEFSKDDQAILDVGCGIGQTLVGAQLETDKLLVGLDIDLELLNFGRRQFGYIKFVNGTAERLPFQNNSFDFVISRVALPYTNIPQSLAEIARVLKENGSVWFTMHSFSKTTKHLKQSIRKFDIKDVVYESYAIANGVFFHFFGRLFYFPVNKRYLSFQTKSGMEKCMKKIGFIEICVQDGNHFVCTARKGGLTLMRSPLVKRQ